MLPLLRDCCCSCCFSCVVVGVKRVCLSVSFDALCCCFVWDIVEGFVLVAYSFIDLFVVVVLVCCWWLFVIVVVVGVAPTCRWLICCSRCCSLFVVVDVCCGCSWCVVCCCC